MSNSQLKAGVPGALRSKKHYEHLKMKRKIYVPSKKMATEIVNRFALSSSTLTDFANNNYMIVDYLRRIIRTSVVENYIANDVLNLLEEKFSTNSVNKNFWSSVKTEREKKTFIVLFILLLLILVSVSIYYSFANTENNTNEVAKKDFIKWVDFNVTAEAMRLTAKLDIDSHNNDEENKYNWIELLAYLACKNGGNFKNFKRTDLDNLVAKLKDGETMESLTQDLKFYDYYYESYCAVLDGFIGNYSIQTATSGKKTDKEKENNAETDNEESSQKLESNCSFEQKYGVKAFLPIAKNYSFSHYDDFGNSRSYGFKRTHLGNDLMGSIGTPVIAVESGVVENSGWNQYGGWRIGIRSFNSKRYYYYAHLRKNHPYAEGLEQGSVVKAGDVIGYLGMTGYSTKENVNNINIPHLHFGMQLIFDESQVDSPNEIWIDVYQIIEFLMGNRSEVFMSNTETKDYSRKYDFIDDTFSE